MKKFSKKELAKRAIVRKNQLEAFRKQLDAMVVIDKVLKDFIWCNYLKTIERYSQITLEYTYKNWNDNTLILEQEIVMKELNLLNIFSDEFKQNIRTEFYIMQSTFDPMRTYDFKK